MVMPGNSKNYINLQQGLLPNRTNSLMKQIDERQAIWSDLFEISKRIDRLTNLEIKQIFGFSVL